MRTSIPDLACPLPEHAAASPLIVSVSGGKDSAATVLALREHDVPVHRYVFADTRWEAPETYEHLATMERVLDITIDRVGAPGGMEARIRARAGFAGRMQRWCTRELKVEPLLAYHAAIAEAYQSDTVSVVGLRAEESKSRAKLPVFGHDDLWGGQVWRPILAWSVEDVLAIHHRHGLPVNPLYLKGFSRVGCWPCGPFASKEDIRLWAQHDPAAVDRVRDLEREMVALRQARNIETPGRYAYPDEASFFQARQRTVAKDGAQRYQPMDVDATVAWSRTARGGVQLKMFQGDPEGGCFRWGMCDPPTTEAEDE